MLVLGLETSCDETAAAIVADDGRVLSAPVLSQLADHKPYGGVVPEIAARSHLDHLDGLIRLALDEAKLAPADLDAIAATAGPGLIGGVMVGLVTAKALALALGKPLIAVNHLEGHALTARLTENLPFPYLLLLVSGGHCQLLAVTGVGQYELYGTTIDDAIGEAFDKTAKLLGLGYPGGPLIEKLAAEGDPAAIPLPRPMLGRPNCDFSFSGLKTAVRQAVEGQPAGALPRRFAADLAAGFQAAAAASLADRCRRAFDRFEAAHGPSTLVLAGGVAANGAIRAALRAVAEKRGWKIAAPPPHLCTDNAAMIAWAGVERLRLGLTDPLTVPARPRWPLAELKERAA